VCRTAKGWWERHRWRCRTTTTVRPLSNTRPLRLIAAPIGGVAWPSRYGVLRGAEGEGGGVFATLQGQEAVIILVIALLILGGSQLPKLVSILEERRAQPGAANGAQGSHRQVDGH
jgi:hypothetical protein